MQEFGINDHKIIERWERIYLEEGPEGLAIERRGRSSKGRPPKQLPKQVEEDLLAEVQRLRAENDYLKICKPWFWKTSDASTKNAGSSEAKAKHALSILLSIAQLPRATFYYHLKRINSADKYKAVKAEITAIYHETEDDTAIAALQQNFTSAISF